MTDPIGLGRSISGMVCGRIRGGFDWASKRSSGPAAFFLKEFTMRPIRWFVAISFVAISAAFLSFSDAQQPFKGKGKGGMDPSQKADMELFHFLLDHRTEITRSITKRDDGVESVTESNNPKVAEKIQKHVASMKKRVEEKRPIHLRDPLFAAIFKNADKIDFRWEKTVKGAKVLETSKDAYVVKLLQAHAEVVSLFLKNGHAEVMKNHELPK